MKSILQDEYVKSVFKCRLSANDKCLLKSVDRQQNIERRDMRVLQKLCMCVLACARTHNITVRARCLTRRLDSVHRGNPSALMMPRVWSTAQVQAHRERASFIQTENAQRDGVLSSCFPFVVDT